MNEPVSLRTVDLNNCSSEPIQIPGSVQPHGALIAFGLDGALTHLSRNAVNFFPGLPPLGQRPSAAQLWSSPVLREAVQAILEDAAMADDVSPLAIEAVVNDVCYDVVLHAHARRVVVEFEPRGPAADDLGSFSILAHRSTTRLRGGTDIDAVLKEVVASVRKLTGFDRVMAYRFHADDSGEIVAEAKSDELEPFLARRFPAADIPVQARRLYVLNTLRLIANVHDEQIRIDAHDPSEPPLNQSYSILRSVSPIHIEYLKNINVAASMSVSIVIGGKLWGLIACHHRAPHRVPYAARMACDVLAQVVATSVQLLTERSAAARKVAAMSLRSTLVDLGDQGEDSLARLGPSPAALNRVISHDRMIFAHGSDIRCDGIGRAAATELLRWLDSQPHDLVALDELSSLSESLRFALAPISGFLAMRHDLINRGWTVLLRNEQTVPVTWSGPPQKVARAGPLGLRLTPDGSLAEWQQDVKGTSLPWDELDMALARLVLDEVARATASRAIEMEQARMHLLAILGHDLRAPLQSISAAAHLIERGKDQTEFARRISATSSRMGRLISQVLDMSRLHGGLGLGLQLAKVDLAGLVRELVDDSLLAHPNAPIDMELPERLIAHVDRDRFAQVVANLLGNARHHGTLGETIHVRLAARSSHAIFEIRNVAAPLNAAAVERLFDPLKKASAANPRNAGGLGLGLFIANESVKGHKGSIVYSHTGSHVVFTVELPIAP